MKNINLNELERWLKRSLKNKVSINDRTVIAFLMAGFMGLSTATYAEYLSINTGAGTVGISGGYGSAGEHNNRGNIALGHSNNITGRYSTLVGAGTITRTDGDYSTAVGYSARAVEGQGTAIGASTYARGQATAIGNDVYAAGISSIAIGNDDIVGGSGFNNDRTRGENANTPQWKPTAGSAGGYVDRLPENTIKKIYGNNENNPDRALGGAKTWSDFAKSYVSDGNNDNRVYSPTFSRGVGAIAIGSRSVAFGDGSTTLGTLSYALAPRSTAIGLRTYADFNATGATAIGEESRVFAPKYDSSGES